MRRRRRSKTYRAISTVIGTLLFIFAAVAAFAAFSVANIAQSDYQNAANQASRLNAAKAQEHLVISAFRGNLRDPTNAVWVNVTNMGGVTSQLVKVIYVYHDSSGSLAEIVLDPSNCDPVGKTMPPAARCSYNSLGLGISFQDPSQRAAIALVTSLGNTYWYNLTNALSGFQSGTGGSGGSSSGFSALVEAVEGSNPVTTSFTINGTQFTTPWLFQNLNGTYILNASPTDFNGKPFLYWSYGNIAISTSRTLTITTGGTYTAVYGSPYDILVEATQGSTPVVASFTLDGISYATPRLFTALTGQVTLVASNFDTLGDPFLRWSNGTSTLTANVALNVTSGGTYVAVYQQNTATTTYSILVTADDGENPISVTFKFDNTNYTTPSIFTGLSGAHTLQASPTTPGGQQFLGWSQNGTIISTTTLLTVNNAGTYTALYQQSVTNYSILVEARSGSTPIAAGFTFDGTKYVAPQIFSSLTGSHTLSANATSPDGKNFLYWESAGTVFSTSRTVNVTAPGTYVAVYEAPGLSVILVASPTSGWPPLNVRFTAFPSGGTGQYTQYVWTFGDGSTFTSTNSTVSHDYCIQGWQVCSNVSPIPPYFAFATVTDSAGKTGTSQVVVIGILNPNGPPGGGFGGQSKVGFQYGPIELIFASYNFTSVVQSADGLIQVQLGCSGSSTKWVPGSSVGGTGTSSTANIVFQMTFVNHDPQGRNITLTSLSQFYWLSSQAAATTTWSIIKPPPGTSPTGYPNFGYTYGFGSQTPPVPSKFSAYNDATRVVIPNNPTNDFATGGIPTTIYFGAKFQGTSTVQKTPSTAQSPFGSIILLIGNYVKNGVVVGTFSQTIPFTAQQVVSGGC